MRPAELLPLAEAVKAIAARQQSAPPADAPGALLLHQYWDVDPPDEVLALLRHNARLCRSWGIGYRLWTKKRAQIFLDAHFPHLRPVFDRAPHPAMACDLLRLCLLHQYGGLYLDADMSLRARKARPLFAMLDQGLMFKWNRADRQNVLNWCFGFQAGNPLCAALIDLVGGSIVAALDRDPKDALKNTLSVSGPGLFTRGVGTWLAKEGAAKGLVILDQKQAYDLIQYGPDSWVPLALRKEPLAYKSTKRHWFRAAADQD